MVFLLLFHMLQFIFSPFSLFNRKKEKKRHYGTAALQASPDCSENTFCRKPRCAGAKRLKRKAGQPEPMKNCRFASKKNRHGFLLHYRSHHAGLCTHQRLVYIIVQIRVIGFYFGALLPFPVFFFRERVPGDF